MISKCRKAMSCCDWYVFGSVARGAYLPADIDILCVVDGQKDILLVRKTCETYLLCAPIHLRILTKKNVSSLNFIEVTSAIQIN